MNIVSLTDNKTLMARARESLQGKWGPVIGTFLVYNLFLILVGTIPRLWGHDMDEDVASSIGGVINLIISGPVNLGFALYTLGVVRGEKVQFSRVFDGFEKFGLAVLTVLLIVVFVLLWGLLLIIPAFVAMLSYAMSLFLIADNKVTKPREALKMSREMMRGHRWKLFFLGWRFFGWFVLSVLSGGVGFLWLIPYVHVSLAHFYNDLKTQRSAVSH